MTKSDLIDEVSRKSGLSRSKVDAVITLFLSAIEDSLVAGDAVKLRGFGAFSVRLAAARVARNPQTGESVAIGERYVPVFQPAEQLRQSIKERSG